MNNLFGNSVVFFLFALAGFSPSLVAGQTAEKNIAVSGPISTDRPTQAYSPSLNTAGTLQIETGFGVDIESNKTDDIMRIDLAGTTLRYAIFDNFEVRASGFYRIKTIDPKETLKDSTITGFGPLRLGFKVFVADEKGWRPQMAIVANITMRHLGNKEFRPVYSYPTASFCASNTLSRTINIVYNAGFAYSGLNADGFFLYRAVLNLNLLPQLILFVEPFGNFDHGDYPNHKIDGGLIWIVNNNLQLDVSVGTGFSNTIDKTFGNLGLSWRIP